MTTFSVTVTELHDLVSRKDVEKLLAFGNVAGLADKLHTSPTSGLNTFSAQAATSIDLSSAPQAERNHLTAPSKSSFDSRIQFYGRNELPPPRYGPFWQFMWDAMHDKTLIVLSVAAALEIGVGIYKLVKANDSLAIIDGAAILLAILAVVFVSSISDYRKQSQFRALTNFSNALAHSTVIRDGKRQQVQNVDIVVGDVLVLSTGDSIPADGLLISGHSLQTDESSLTGESDAIKKNEKDPFLLSGTKVTNGTGQMLVTCVGPHSINGQTLLSLSVEAEETPLQVKLSKLADFIAKFGIAAAGIMVVILLIAYFTVITPGDRRKMYIKDKKSLDPTLVEEAVSADLANDIINVFISAVTLIVVAVPEGLPMAVTLALGHAMLKMLKDQNLVRHLKACETMGNATTICSDKTGTLTMNRMTVVKGTIYAQEFDIKDMSSLDKFAFKKDLSVGLNINSTACESMNQSGKSEFIGSKTEVAILEFTRKLGFEYAKDREELEPKIIDVLPFSSETKSMTTIVDMNGQAVVFSKGASEIILKSCTHYLDNHGQNIVLSDKMRSKFESLIHKFASQALRTIGVARKVREKEGEQVLENLTLLAILAIQDPVRPEVPDAVLRCQKAGVVVRMVTGDNQETARSIARECGILTNGVVMEGPVFRELSDKERRELVPSLQVLARSSPMDKQVLVKTLKSLGETVAVTGDGTNDAPALKAADVGFSMGIAGTEVAKEASDIVLLDDNFASLVKAVIWGRSVYDSVRKFLQFQLTVNVTAVVLTVVTSILSTFLTEKKIPFAVFSAVQLLWVNMIMDTFAALALATDPPSESLLNRRPDKKSDPLLSVYMRRQIIGQAVYQIIICLVIYLQKASSFGVSGINAISTETGIDVMTSTLVFNTFVFCQIFNEINARSITNRVNIFEGLHKNQIFIWIFILTVIAQAIIVEFGSTVFKTVEGGLPAMGWLVSIAFGFGSLPVGLLIRVLFPTVKEEENVLEVPEDALEDVLLNPAIAPQLLHDAGDAHTHMKVVNTFKDAKEGAAFERGLRVGAEMAKQGIVIESDGSVKVDRERVQQLWGRAREIHQHVSFVRALRGARREVVVMPGDRISVRSKDSLMSV